MSLEQLRLHREVVALEAFALPDIKALAYRIIPNIISEFKGFITQISPSQPAIKLTSVQKNFLNELKKHSYLDLTPLQVYVPEGLQTGYKAYCEALESAAKLAENLPTELANYKAFISQLMGADEQLRSTRWDEKDYELMSGILAKSIEATSLCFAKNSTEANAKYSQVVQNNKEWEAVFGSINEIVLRIEKIKRTDLLKEISAIDHLLEMFQNKIKRNEIDNISPEMLSKISDYTYMVAQYLEYYSVTHFRIRVLAEAISQSVEKVYSIITRTE